MAKLFGESIPDYVKKQIEVRQNILGANGLQGIRTDRDLQYLTQKGAWIRMISGINVEIANNPGVYTSKVAENFILSGGVLKWNSLAKKFERNTNFSVDNTPGRYSLSENLGIRPEPGITSFDISHKNRFGTIREASISFNVWTREDLEKAQTLFLRPGAQIMVEWGNSIYVNNDGEIEDIPVYESLNDFFKNVSVEKIYQNINYFKSQTFGNYDAFLGLVTNFNWEYRNDGGYDCSIRVISRSAILESLTLLKPVNFLETDDYYNSDARTSLLHSFIYGCKYQKDIPSTGIKVKDLFLKYTSIPKELQEEQEKDKGFSTLGVQNVAKQAVLANQIEKGKISVYNLLKQKLTFTGNEEEVGSGTVIRTGPSQDAVDFIDNIRIFGFNKSIDDENNPISNRYVSLRTFLFLVNTSFIVNSTPGFDAPLFYLGEELSKSLKESLNIKGILSAQKYRTFKEHFSLDPYVAILPKIPTFNFEDVDRNKLYLDNIDSDTLKVVYSYARADVETRTLPFQVMPNLVSRTIESITPRENRDDILNIYVNLEFIKEVLDTYIAKDTEVSKIVIRDFVMAVLTRIQTSLGSVNSFDIHFDEDLQKNIIVDREIVNEEVEASPTKITVLNVTGLNSTVSDIKIQSKISSELSSTIAISNQATKPDDIQSDVSLIDWNRGTKNRFFIPQSQADKNPSDSTSGFSFSTQPPIDIPGNTSATPSNSEEEKEKKQLLDFLISVKEGYNSFNKINTAFYRSKYKREFFDRLKGEGSLVFKKFYFRRDIPVGTGTVLKEQQTTTDSSLEISTGKSKKTQKEDQGIIPIELSMTLDGIGGMKIGQIFKLGSLDKPSNLLPEIYNKYGFIITGLDNTISENGKWLTTIKALTFKTG